MLGYAALLKQAAVEEIKGVVFFHSGRRNVEVGSCCPLPVPWEKKEALFPIILIGLFVSYVT